MSDSKILRSVLKTMKDNSKKPEVKAEAAATLEIHNELWKEMARRDAVRQAGRSRVFPKRR